MNGVANPNRAATTGWFRYSLTSPSSCNDTFGSRAPISGGSSLGSGSSSTSYGQSVSGLSQGTTYYYCAIVSSSEGTAFGEVLQFVTSTAPAVTTAAATPVTSTSATLNGSANPGGASATGWFRYGTSSPGTCNDSFGTRAPSSSGASLGYGSSSVAYSLSIGGLLPATTYYVCAIANNSYGTGFGAVLSFTTPASPPAVSTDLPTIISSTAATLNGSANPNGAATTGWFRIASANPGVCNDSFGTRVPTSSGTSLGAGTSAVTYAYPAPGIVPGVTYYYCAIASNPTGISFGTVRAFAVPTVTTLAATPVTATTATLNGSVTPNGGTATGWFRYATSNPSSCNDTFGTRAPSASGIGLGSGAVPVGYSQSLGGLASGTTYYFCAIASTSIGNLYGVVLSFTTPSSGSRTSSEDPVEPTIARATVSKVTPVTTLAASPIVTDSAVLNATANPSGDQTTGWFRYSAQNPGTCNDTFGTRAPEGGSATLGADNSSVGYAQAVTGLVPGTTYYYCAVVANAARTSFGEIMSFVPGERAPAATPEAPATVDGSSAPVDAADAVQSPEVASQGMGGCVYSANSGGRGSIFWLMSILPLAGLLVLRRRRRQS
jgi:hypothetical protein